MNYARYIYCALCDETKWIGSCCGSCKKCMEVSDKYDDCAKCHEKLINDFWVTITSIQEGFMDDKMCVKCYYEVCSEYHGKPSRIDYQKINLEIFYDCLEEDGKAEIHNYLEIDWDNVQRSKDDGKVLKVKDKWKHWIPKPLREYNDPLNNNEWRIWCEPPEEVITIAKTYVKS